MLFSILYRDSPQVRPPCEQDHGLITGVATPNGGHSLVTLNFVTIDSVKFSLK